MAFREDELIARLRSGERTDHVACWYIHEIMKNNPREEDLSPFELAFFREIERSYRKWKRERKLN
jgi:hypothetical protein